MSECDRLTNAIEIQNTVTSAVPETALFEAWITTVLQAQQLHGKAVCVRIVDEPAITQLNHEFRQKNKPTNVLAFPQILPDDIEILPQPLGDIVICAPVVVAEAQAQGKTVEAHWAHLTTHGLLHLLGYDHLTDAEAEEMEALEKRYLSQQGYPDPYLDEPNYD